MTREHRCFQNESHCRKSIAGRTVVFLLLFLAIQQPLWAQGILAPGETLRYKVRWTFIRLGTVEIRQCEADTERPGMGNFVLTVKSASGLPFIDLDFTHTITAALQPLEVQTVTVQNNNDNHEKTTYSVDRTGQRVVVVDSCNGEEILCDTVSIADRCYEVLSLLFMARAQASSNGTAVVPTMVGRSVGETLLQFTGQTEEIDVPALDEPIEAYHFRGDARWVGSGFAGMQGEFRGWVSKDEAAVPLRGEVGIFLGSIVLELESFDRPSWPPLDTASVVVTPKKDGDRP